VLIGHFEVFLFMPLLIELSHPMNIINSINPDSSLIILKRLPVQINKSEHFLDLIN